MPTVLERYETSREYLGTGKSCTRGLQVVDSIGRPTSYLGLAKSPTVSRKVIYCGRVATVGGGEGGIRTPVTRR